MPPGNHCLFKVDDDGKNQSITFINPPEKNNDEEHGISVAGLKKSENNDENFQATAERLAKNIFIMNIA